MSLHFDRLRLSSVGRSVDIQFLKLNVKIGWNRIERENVFQKKKWKKERGRIQPEVTDITSAQKPTEQYDQNLHPYMEVTPYTF